MEYVIFEPASIKLEYNKFTDKSEVSQTGFLDLGKAYANNSVPSQVDEDDSSYNGIEDPSHVLGKPKDIFEAMHYKETLSNYKAPSNNPSGDANDVE